MTKKWWHEKVAYQIYPKSFCDSNGDGIGDLRGIISKLDYLRELGIDIVWLSPIYCSPLADQGYDIADYYTIDPRFGTMEEMEELIAEGKKRGIQILMDLVVNHCSDEHEWFKKACEDPDGKYGKYFYIVDAKDGKLPSNSRAYFGGCVWDKLPGHEDKYYYHAFHKKQPDLNWENEEVREEVYKNINWWLDKGLGGFRIDAIINIKKALPFKHYPADREDGLSDIRCMLRDAHGIGEFLQEMKERTFDLYDAFSVGEVFDSNEPLANFIAKDGYFSSMFDFNTTIIGASGKGWHDHKGIKPSEYIEAVFESQEAVKEFGFLANIIENHDEPRGCSRYLPDGICTERGKKMLALTSFMARGIPFIYEGQEIGMENTEFSNIEEVDDINTIDEYQVCLDAGYTAEEALKIVAHHSRDNARVPMQWTGEEGVGFTTGTPWLKVNPNYERINVETQLADKNSLWYFYQNLIQLRKNPEYKDVVVYGEFIPYRDVNENVMAFYRKDSNQSLFIVANFSHEEEIVLLPGEVKTVIMNNDDFYCIENGAVRLKEYQAMIIEM
ncbi:MAG: alpha-glucosidase [Eubacteriales bacterium]